MDMPRRLSRPRMGRPFPVSLGSSGGATRRFAMAAGLASLLGAAAAGSAPAPDPSAGAALPRILSETKVTFAPDGSHTIEVFHPSTDGLSPRSLTVSGGCTGPLEAFFDAPVGAAEANEVCFSGTGTIELSDVARPGGGTWSGVIQSYLTQASAGYFSVDAAGDSRCSAFGVTTTQTNLAESDANALYLTVGPSACPILRCKTGYFYCGTDCGYEKQECIVDSACNPPPNIPPALRYDWCCEHMDTCP